MLHLYLPIYTHASELLFDWFFHHNGFVILITGGLVSFLVVKYCNNRRVQEHKNKRNPRSFTSRYNCNKLVYFEVFSTPMEAICKEKQLKNGNRKRKNSLVNKMNPSWEEMAVSQ